MNDYTNDYKSLHECALRLSTRMLAGLPQETLHTIASCTASGAKLMIQFSLPDCKQIEIVLQEIEGKRTPVCRLGTSND